MAELDGGRIAAVLAADTAVNLGSESSYQGSTAISISLPTPMVIKSCERIRLIDLVGVVCRQELAGIVTAEAEGHLSKVVGAEAEELSFLSDLVSSQSSSRNLDHGTNFVLKVGRQQLR